MCVTIEIYARRRKVLFVCLFESRRELLSSDFSCLTWFASFANHFDLFDHIRLVEVSTEFVMDPYSINVQHGFMFIDNYSLSLTLENENFIS